jgi:hypothetical protein
MVKLSTGVHLKVERTTKVTEVNSDKPSLLEHRKELNR